MIEKDDLNDLSSVDTLLKMFNQQPETAYLGGSEIPSDSVEELVDKTLRKLLAQGNLSAQQITLLDVLLRNRGNIGE